MGLSHLDQSWGPVGDRGVWRAVFCPIRVGVGAPLPRGSGVRDGRAGAGWVAISLLVLGFSGGPGSRSVAGSGVGVRRGAINR